MGPEVREGSPGRGARGRAAPRSWSHSPEWALVLARVTCWVGQGVATLPQRAFLGIVLHNGKYFPFLSRNNKIPAEGITGTLQSVNY